MDFSEIKFGVGFLAGNNLAQMIKMSKVAEENNFISCWIAEDYFYGGAFSTATVCAMNTSSINIGIGVINPYTRHPALTAMELGVLDNASAGRVILGIGASNPYWIEEQMGIPFKKPLSAINDSINIIRALIENSAVEYCGNYFKTGKIELDFSPFRSKIPIYMGVKGPKALQMAGKLADGLLLSIMTSEKYIAYALEKVQEGARQINRALNDLDMAAYLVIYIAEDGQQAREAVKPLIAKYLGLHGIHPILTSTGMDEPEIMRFRKAFLAGKDASDLVTDWMIDTFAVVGTPEKCREKLKSLYQAGITHPIAFQIPGIPIEETIMQIKKYITG